MLSVSSPSYAVMGFTKVFRRHEAISDRLLTVTHAFATSHIDYCDSTGIQEYGWSHNISCIVAKTMYMAFNPKGTETCEPSLTIDGNEQTFVSKINYLGVT